MSNQQLGPKATAELSRLSGKFTRRLLRKARASARANKNRQSKELAATDISLADAALNPAALARPEAIQAVLAKASEAPRGKLGPTTQQHRRSAAGMTAVFVIAVGVMAGLIYLLFQLVAASLGHLQGIAILLGGVAVCYAIAVLLPILARNLRLSERVGGLPRTIRRRTGIIETVPSRSSESPAVAAQPQRTTGPGVAAEEREAVRAARSRTRDDGRGVVSGMTMATPPGGVKPGWRTSEFWQTLFVHAIAAVVALGTVFHTHFKLNGLQAIVPAVAVLASAVAQSMYSHSRAVVKASAQAAGAQVGRAGIEAAGR